MDKVICLMGPTASGKTALACSLYDALPGEVDLISVDSAMIYRGMDIGTAKPPPGELARYPHALIDILDPAEHYSAAEFVSDATACIEATFAAGKTPVLVGGTMMYFNALIKGLAPLPERDPDIRAHLEQEAEAYGWPVLHQRLVACDPTAAAQIAPQDAQRISRALEVHMITGKPISTLQTRQQPLKHKYVCMGVMPEDRSELYAKIEQRLDEMLAQGFVGEVEALFKRGDLQLGMPSMRAVGYRQLWQYCTGEWSLEMAREKALVATRQLAKRQMTWLRGWEGLHLMPAPDLDKLKVLIS